MNNILAILVLITISIFGIGMFLLAEHKEEIYNSIKFKDDRK